MTDPFEEMLIPDFALPEQCVVCGELSKDCAPDEGGGGAWCPVCRDKWEKESGRHWEDGKPIEGVKQ